MRPAFGRSPSSGEDFLLVDLDRFQGPLDLLLHLIRQQDIDIFDIPIATITDQFLVAVQEIGVEDLDGAGEFLEMAATLIRIKAQMLLPRPVDEEDEDPRAELVRRLLEYEQIREISSRLSRSEAETGPPLREGVRGAPFAPLQGGHAPGDHLGGGVRGRHGGGASPIPHPGPSSHDGDGGHRGEDRTDPRNAEGRWPGWSSGSLWLPGRRRCTVS